MARIDALPSLEVIRGLHGILDFYYWRGLPCVRAWPTGKHLHRSDAEIASSLLFGAVIKAYSLLGDGALEAYRDMALDIPRTARDIMVSGVYGHLHERTEAAPPPPPEEQMYDAYVCLRDVKPPTTGGGDFWAGAWQTRDLNEKQADPKDICTLEANQFVLAAGSYRASIHCPAYRVNRNQARLYNVTGSTVLLLGSSGVSNYQDSTVSGSHVFGRFTVAADQTLQIEHQCSYTRSDTGLGSPCTFADEIYTIAEFWREIEPE